MANVVSCEAVTRRHAEKTVLADVTFGIADRDRVGVIGVNGSGKSTLLKLVAGVLEPDAGRVAVSNDVRIDYLSQEPEFAPGTSPVEAVLSADTPLARTAKAFERASAALRAAPDDATAQAAFEAAGARMDAEQAWDTEHRARAMLDRLGVGELDGVLDHRSGGERKRVALASVLLEPAELLILDEPTNHLDVDIVEWLQDQLVAWSRALLLVTHDRYLLDAVATRIVEVHDAGLHSHSGGYSSYLEARELRLQQAQATEKRRANRARTELEWLRRGPKARTSKAKHRVERAKELVEGGPAGPLERPEVQIDLPSRRIGTKVVNLHSAGVTYGDRQVLREVDHKLDPRARIGLVGPNGSGKTTLLRLIAGEVEPTQGSVRHGETAHVGFFRQIPRDLTPRTRVIDAVYDAVRETELTSGLKVTASQLLERFLFDNTAQKAYVEELSGGERRRLELLLVLAEAPNLLLLDEPTNDLDLDTLAVLEEFLDAWPGAMVVASHDRYFLDRACSDLFAIEGGVVEHYPGGWSAYRETQRERRRLDQQAAAARPKTDPLQAGTAPGTSKREKTKRSYGEQREFAQLGARIAELEARRDELAAALETEDDYVRLAELGREATQVAEALASAEERWLELSMIGDTA